MAMVMSFFRWPVRTGLVEVSVDVRKVVIARGVESELGRFGLQA